VPPGPAQTPGPPASRDGDSAARTAARLQAILEAAVDGILTIDATGRIVAANRAAESIFGYRSDEMLGRNVALLMPPPYRDEHGGYLSRYLATGERKIIGIGREVLGRRKDGSTFPMYLAVGEANAGAERLFTGIVRDLSERKRLEQQLQQAQKMEAMGQLASGIAHDFNNLLAVIQGSSEMLLASATASDRDRRAAERIHLAAQRGTRLAGQLLAFSWRDPVSRARIDVDQHVEGMRDLLARLIGEDIELKLILSGSASTVLLDPGHLDQILMNLVVNAGAAMPGGGQLKIETQSVTLNGDRAAKGLSLDPGPYVVLIVEDTGTGIPAEHLPRLFDPFFTTKGPGRGTGLGLATVHAIATRNRGAVAVETRLGVGTRFEVFLPRADEAVAGATPVVAPAQARPRSSPARVLLVEDDDLLRDLAVEVLEEEGHSVTTAASADEALLAARSAGPFDLLLTDVVMPGMTAGELADRLGTLNPGLRVVFMSGHTDARLADRGYTSEGANFIRKPFDASTLAAKVAEILAAPL
jgi:PAS domain S-box-containing protein